MNACRITKFVFFLALATAAQAAPPIELELATERGVQITAPREWLQLFTGLGIDNVRIRGAQAGDEPAVDNRGTAERPRYYVLGIITPGNELRLAGGTFGRGDRAGIQDYFDRLATDGAAALTAPHGRFGLTEKELQAVLADLAQPIDFETKGQPPRTVLDRLQAKLAHAFALDADANAALQKATPFVDELNGLTVGTGTAMLLRSYGLVLRPEKPRGQPIVYRVVKLDSDSDTDALARSTLGKEADESPTCWPIGWEPDAAPVIVAPSLFEQLNAEIDGYTLAETLAAIGPRLKLPLYLDHAALAASKIDPTAINVALPRTRTSYSRVLNRVLAQARLGSQLRVDEAGKPFLWVTR